MSESETFPYAAEGADRIGAPPVNGEGGERGSSAFTGNDDYNADGTPKDPAAPAVGPGTGDSYHEAQTYRSLGTHSEGSRESDLGDAE